VIAQTELRPVIVQYIQREAWRPSLNSLGLLFEQLFVEAGTNNLPKPQLLEPFLAFLKISTSSTGEYLSTILQFALKCPCYSAQFAKDDEKCHNSIYDYLNSVRIEYIFFFQV
jgi:hypothetical protein